MLFSLLAIVVGCLPRPSRATCRAPNLQERKPPGRIHRRVRILFTLVYFIIKKFTIHSESRRLLELQWLDNRSAEFWSAQFLIICGL
jgi:hypothetical protein